MLLRHAEERDGPRGRSLSWTPGQAHGARNQRIPLVGSPRLVGAARAPSRARASRANHKPAQAARNPGRPLLPKQTGSEALAGAVPDLATSRALQPAVRDTCLSLTAVMNSESADVIAIVPKAVLCHGVNGRRELSLRAQEGRERERVECVVLSQVIQAALIVIALSTAGLGGTPDDRNFCRSDARSR
jgi:hypothetical protein